MLAGEEDVLAWQHRQRRRQHLPMKRCLSESRRKRLLITNVSPILEATKTPREENISKLNELQVICEAAESVPWDYAEAIAKGYDVQRKWVQDKMSDTSMCLNVNQESDMCDPTEWRDVYMQPEFDDLTGETLAAELAT